MRRLSQAEGKVEAEKLADKLGKIPTISTIQEGLDISIKEASALRRMLQAKWVRPKRLWEKPTLFELADLMHPSVAPLLNNNERFNETQGDPVVLEKEVNPLGKKPWEDKVVPYIILVISVTVAALTYVWIAVLIVLPVAILIWHGFVIGDERLEWRIRKGWNESRIIELKIKLRLAQEVLIRLGMNSEECERITRQLLYVGELEFHKERDAIVEQLKIAREEKGLDT